MKQRDQLVGQWDEVALGGCGAGAADDVVYLINQLIRCPGDQFLAELVHPGLHRRLVVHQITAPDQHVVGYQGVRRGGPQFFLVRWREGLPRQDHVLHDVLQDPPGARVILDHLSLHTELLHRPDQRVPERYRVLHTVVGEAYMPPLVGRIAKREDMRGPPFRQRRHIDHRLAGVGVVLGIRRARMGHEAQAGVTRHHRRDGPPTGIEAAVFPSVRDVWESRRQLFFTYHLFLQGHTPARVCPTVITLVAARSEQEA